MPILSLIGGVVVAVALVWLLARAMRRLTERRLTDDVEELRDSVWSWDSPRNGLLRRLRGRFQRAGQAKGAVPLDHDPDTPAGNVRALYRGLLRLGAHRGRRRTANETPDEYERALAAADLFGPRLAELHLLTELYADVRYGTEQPGPARVSAARAALEQLELLERPVQAGPDS